MFTYLYAYTRQHKQHSVYQTNNLPRGIKCHTHKDTKITEKHNSVDLGMKIVYKSRQVDITSTETEKMSQI